MQNAADVDKPDLEGQLRKLATVGADDKTARQVQEALDFLVQTPRRPTNAARLYIRLLWAEQLAGAEVVLTRLLPPGATDTALLWPWRLFHLALCGDKAGILQHVARMPDGATLHHAWWHRIVVLCERHLVGCGAALRRLAQLNLPDVISVPAILAAPINVTPAYAQRRIEKLTRMRSAMGIATPPEFAVDCQRATLLGSVLLTYALDALNSPVYGRDCMLDAVTIQENPDWTACLATGHPFVLAGFHAGPIIDAGWPARAARIPLFHLSHLTGSRNNPHIRATETISPYAFLGIAQEIVRQKSGLIISPDFGRGLRDTGMTIGDEPIKLFPLAASLAHRMQADVFFCRASWTETGILVEITTGPRARTGMAMDAWEQVFNAAYVAQLGKIVVGNGLNNLLY